MSDPIKYDSTSSQPSGLPEEDFQYPDPYANYQGDDFGDDFGFGNDTGGDQYIGGDDSSGGGAGGPSDMSPNGIRYWLDDLRKQGLISQAQFDAYTAQVNAASGASGPAQDAALSKIVGDVNTALNPPAPASDDGLGDLGDLGDGGQADPGADLKTRIDDLISKINASDLPESTKTKLVGDLQTAEHSIELNPSDDQISAAEDKLGSIEEQFTSLSTMPKEALNIAAAFPNKTPDEIQSAASDAGLDLSNLPNPPDDKVLNFLQSIGALDVSSSVSEYNRIKKERDDNMATTKADCEADTNTWRSNSEDPPSTSKFQKSFDYFQKKDSEYQQMEGQITDIQSKVSSALQKLGYNVTPGETPDRISVNGTNLDIFNENSGELTLSTTMTELTQDSSKFAEAPRNTEMTGPWDGGDTREGINNKWFHENDPEGYPETTFDSG